MMEGEAMMHITTFTILLAVLALAVWGQQTTAPLIHLEPSTVPTVFVLRSPNGEARIDFGGKQVTYSGELPVHESAKIFFDAVMGHLRPPQSDLKARCTDGSEPDTTKFSPCGDEPHRWASDLLKEKREDGCRWKYELVGPTVVLQCPTGEPDPSWRFSNNSVCINCDDPPAWKEKERYTLDFCIVHGETRVLKEKP